jgi:glycosyltransferase involved in cell wall biosynthesis
MIEAMARALPCIGTTVGGVAELLPEEDLVKPNNASELSFRIEEILSDPQRRAAMSARNLARAQEYRSHILRERRIAFYEILRARTEEWLKTVRGRM